MRIYTKILVTTLPLIILSVFAGGALTWQLSSSALLEMAERWLQSRLYEAIGTLNSYYSLPGSPPNSISDQQLNAAAGLQNLDMGNQGIIIVLNSKGEILTAPGNEFEHLEIDNPVLIADLTSSTSERINFSINGKKYIGSHAYYKPWDWYLIAAAPVSVVYGDSIRAGIMAALSSLAVAGLFVITLIWLTKRLASPLELLEAGAQEMGEGNLKVRIPVTTNDEIGSFARVFNQMAIQLDQSLEALKTSEQHYRSLIENSSDLILILNQDGLVTYSDPSTTRSLGYDPGELTGRSIIDFMHPQEKAFAEKTLERVIQYKDISVPIELRIRHKNGSWMYFEAAASNLLDELSVGGIVLTLRNIWERKQAEKIQQSIYQISESVIKSDNLEELFRAVHAIISELMPAKNFYVALYDEASGLLNFPYYIDEFDAPPDPQKLGKGLTEYVLRTSVPLLASPEIFDELVAQGEVDSIGAPSIDWLGVPLQVNGRNRGVLVLQSYSEDVRFEEKDKEILTFVSEQAAMAILRKQAEDAVRENEARYRELFENSPISLWEEDFSGIRDYIESLKDQGIRDFETFFNNHPECAEAAMKLIRVIDVNHSTLRLYGAPSKEELVSKMDRVFGKETLKMVTDELIAIANGEKEFEGIGVNYRLDGTKIYIVLRWSVAESYTSTFSRVIVSIVDVTDRKRAEEQAHAQLQRLNALRAIDTSITASLDLKATLNVLLDQVTQQLNVDAAAVLLLEPNILTLHYAAGRGFHTSALQHTKLRLGEGYAGKAALDRILISNLNLQESPGELKNSPLLADEDFVTYFAEPLIAKGQVMGVLEIFHRKMLKPSQEWLDFLDTLGRQAAIAIDNATLFIDLQRSNIELTLAYDATIEGWSRALDLRDRETEGHTQRVTEVTLQLAKILGISNSTLVYMRWGSLLHDIGKMGIPDSILAKPGPLTEEEWVFMRKHPVYAYEMLLPIQYLRPALDIPYYHHERWDGSGYPCKLKKEEIPLAARIFSVVDVWDALRSDRPYRKAWPEEQVHDYIRDQAGKEFDPHIVATFMELIERRKIGD
ncbi:MAG: PAS domain S-box protein [Chloroflexi bacterium]|nr:MAG: PAS domain S-box protein [Chloroflexota bacterium]